MSKRITTIAACLALLGCPQDESTIGIGIGDPGGGATTGGTEEDAGATGADQITYLPGEQVIYQLVPATGPTSGETVVSIKGVGFRAEARVYFGGTEAELVKVIDTGRITAITPVGVAGAVDVRVENPDGGVGLFVGGFTYYALGGGEQPRPALLEAIPNTGPADGGTLLLVKGDHFQQGATLFLDYVPMSGVDVTSVHWASFTTPKTEAGTFDIAITNPDGQSDILTDAFSSYPEATETVPGPSVSKVHPSSGSVHGGLEVTVTGAELGQASKLVLDGEPVDTWEIVSPTEGRFVTPPHAPGLANVAVTNWDGQTGVLNNGFLFYVEPPVLFSLEPDHGPVAGGNEVALKGANFVQGMTVTIGGKECTGAAVVAASSAGDPTGTATCTVPPGDTAGPVAVEVTNPDGLSGLLPAGYTYTGPPTITAVSPDSGPAEGGYVAILMGLGFPTGSTVTFGGVAAEVLSVESKGIGVVVPPHTAGTVDVTVSAPGYEDTTLLEAFTYLELGPPAISGVMPASGPAEGGIVVAVSGENLRPESAVWFGGTKAESVSYGGPTGVAITLPAGTGTVDVTLKTPGFDDSTLEAAFTYVALGPPAITGLSPTSGPVDGGTVVSITGENLRPETQVYFGGQLALLMNYGGPTGVAVSAPAGTGTVDVTIKTPGFDDSTLDAAFTYTALGPPMLSSLSPGSGPVEGGTVVSIAGLNLRPESEIFFGAQKAPLLTYGGPAGIAVTAPPGAAGAVDVTLQTPGFESSVLPAAYTYVTAGPPVLTGVTPGNGPVEGGIVVAVTGENFRDNSSVWFGDVQAVAKFYGGDEGIGVLLPAGAAGVTDVTVKTPGFDDTTLEKAFVYTEAGDPVISGVSPATGPAEGGIVVAISGENLRPDSTVWFGDQKASQVSFGGPSGIAVSLPPGDAGTVDVVVKTPGYPDAALPASFTYTAMGPPSIAGVTPSQGPAVGGIVVAVTGQNLRPESVVWFGGQKAASASYGGPDGIGVVLPAAAAGAVDVIVKTPGFPDAVLQGAFQYVEQGPPVALSVVPANGPTDGGIVVVVKGQDLRAESQVWFGEVEAPALYATGSDGLAVALPPAKAGSVDVTVKTPGFVDSKLAQAFTYEPPEVPVGQLILVSQVQPNMGPTTGGGWALVKGFNLPTDAVVTFGGTPSTEVVPLNGQTLSVRVPAAAAAGAVDIVVEDPVSGLGGELPQSYSYYLPGDAPNAAPGLDWVKPPLGPAVGGTLAWLSGDGLLGGALVFVDGRPSDQVTVPSISNATFVTPPGEPGPADVMLVNSDGQWAELESAFVYTTGGVPSVTITGALPGQGSVAGGTSVTVVGTGFSPGVTVFIDGVPVVSKLAGPNAIQITTPPHGPGLVDLHVTAPDGWTAGLDDAFNYILQAPFAVSIAPSWGSPDGGTEVVIAGQGFHPQAKALFGGVEAVIKASSDNVLTVITPPAAEPGFVDVTVQNPDFLSSTMEGAFEYTDVVPGDLVQVHAVHPPVAPTTGGTGATLTGIGFEPGATVLAGAEVGENVVILSPTTLLFDVPPGEIGPKDVSVVVPEVGQGTLKNALFHYDPLSPLPFPEIAGIEPGIGPTTGGTIARVDVVPAMASARVFVGGVEADVLGSDAALNYLVVEMPPHEAGPVSVSVMLVDGKADTLIGAFTYYEASPGLVPPKLTLVEPDNGSTLGGQTVTLTGASFGAAPLAFLGYQTITELETVNATTLSGMTPPHETGLVSAVVTRQDGLSATLLAAYAYSAPPPVPEAVFPTLGHIDGGLTVAVSGSGFAAGAQVFLDDVEATAVHVPAANVLTFVTPPTIEPGPRTVIVLNPDGKSGELAGGFAYTDQDFADPPPVITAMVPAKGPFQGGTVLALFGSGFQENAIVLFGSVPAKVHVIDTDLVTVTTPPGFIGSVDVAVLNPDGQSGTLPGGFKYIVTQLPKPELYTITPKSGPENGGTNVILTGSKITGGGVGFVGYRPLSSWTVLNSAIATGTTAVGTPGATDVVTTNGDGQSAILTDGWTYVGAPHIDSFNPTMGAVAGGKVVHIAGKNFDVQAKVEIGGKPAVAVQVLSASVIKFQTPTADPGPAQIKVTNPDGQWTIADDPYLYVLPPTILSAFPTKGSAEGGTPVILMGQDFLEGAVAHFGDAEVLEIAVVDKNTIVVRSPPGEVGTVVDLHVTNPDGQDAILYKAFTYVDPADIGPAPSISALTPPTGPTSGGTWGLAAAENLQEKAWLICGTTPAFDFEVLSPELGRFVTAAAKAPGTTTVVVINPDGGFGELPDGFTYTDPLTLDAEPDVTSVDPTRGPTKGGTKVTLSGAELDAETVVFYATTPAVAVTAVEDGSGVIATTPAHPLGKVDVTVTDAEGQTVTWVEAFEYVPPPQLSLIDPTSGPSAGATFMTLTGMHFWKGETAATSTRVLLCESFEEDLNCVQVIWGSTTIVDTQTIQITTPEHVPGLKDVVVLNPDGQSAVLPQAYLYNPPPKIAAVVPEAGSTLGGETVQVLGTGFKPNCKVKFGDLEAFDVVIVASDEIQCTTPPHPAGPVSVTITNPDLSTDTLGGGFKYIRPPEITNLFPTLGPEPGGTDVIIQGKGFVVPEEGVTEGTLLYFGGEEVTGDNVTVVSESLIQAVTPPGKGPVSVKVVNPDGQIDIIGGGFVYIPLIPPPTINSITPTFGQTGGGILVEIIGSGYLDGVKIGFGTEEMGWTPGINPLVKNAGTLITCILPAHPKGKVHVRVTNSDGQFAQADNGFEFVGPIDIPGLKFQGISPSRGPVAGGYDVYVYGQGFKLGIIAFFGHESTSSWVQAAKTARLGPTLLRVTMAEYPSSEWVDVRLVNPAFGGVIDEVVEPDAYYYGQSVILEPKGHRLPPDTSHDDKQALIFDANGDGLNDVMVLHHCYNGCRDDLLINTVDAEGQAGKFVDQSATSLPVIGNSWQHNTRHNPVAIDLDNDGDKDVLMRCANEYLCKYTNQGDGTFTFHYLGDHDVQNASNFVVADFNCDGLEDIFIPRDGINYLYFTNGNGGIYKINGVLPDHDEPTRGSAAADIDKDGDMDLLLANDNAFQNRLYYNNCNNVEMAPACASAVQSCTMKEWNGHRYAFCKFNRTWKDAQTYCQTYGSGQYNLVTIEDQAEQTFVRQHIGGYGWIGYTDQEEEGSWMWPFGSSTFTKWCSGYPNSSDCARMSTGSDGCWHSVGCTEGRYFVCETTKPACEQDWQFSDATYGKDKNFPVSGFSSKQARFGDLNMDGWPDAVMFNAGGDDRIYFNNGGNFINDDGLHYPQNESQLSSHAGWLEDIDLDGDFDIISRKGNNWPRIYLSNAAQGGAAIFEDVSDTNRPPKRAEDSSYHAVGDLNGDGLVDIYIVNTNYQDWVLLNDGYAENQPLIEASRVGKGAFANNTFFGMPEDAWHTYAADVGDIDGDGDIDIVMGNARTHGFRVWINDSSGDFFEETTERMPAADVTKCNMTDMQLVDLNGDDDLDIVAACRYDGTNSGSGGMRQLVNDGEGYFTPVGKVNFKQAGSGWNPYNNEYWYCVAPGDFDADGDIDLHYGMDYSWSTDFKTYMGGGDPFNNDGAYFFDVGTSMITTSGIDQHEKRRMLVMDLNADKVVDLYMANWNKGNRLFYNDGTGYFVDKTASHLPNIADKTWHVMGRDVDFDGDVDIFVSNEGTNRLHVGELDFKYADVTVSHTPSMGSNSYFSAFGDLDMDGLPDIVTANYGSKNHLLLNQGDAHFGNFHQSMPSDADYSRSVHIADFDGDGRLDVFFAGIQADRIYLNRTPKPAP